MSKKLYKAEMTTVVYFLAEEPTEPGGRNRLCREAGSIIKEAERDACTDTDEPPQEVCDGDPIEGNWDKMCLVYGADKDTYLGDAMKEFGGPMRPGIKKMLEQIKKAEERLKKEQANGHATEVRSNGGQDCDRVDRCDLEPRHGVLKGQRGL